MALGRHGPRGSWVAQQVAGVPPARSVRVCVVHVVWCGVAACVVCVCVFSSPVLPGGFDGPPIEYARPF